MSNLQNNSKAETEKNEQLEAQKNEELEKQKAELLAANAKNLEFYSDDVFNYFYMFWKSNRNVDFSYLPKDVNEEDQDKCL